MIKYKIFFYEKNTWYNAGDKMLSTYLFAFHVRQASECFYSEYPDTMIIAGIVEADETILHDDEMYFK
ncbi:hypothetical protein VF04_34985 [Nostoc linckia z7]|uniref:Uncharacterized protein n=1 Tax=Nostoc linckia z7 TaxID=1628745 RepID=A0ABX4KBY5_NOSLI|nr:hypothetical protein VF02_37875 [Nostoc linckia z1]PHJ59268.1 hypothetical protein VF05_32260 [Nostoc linckia z3]PHJ63663.1 hypothetical protein VF03_30135 [Nostoc linckia z2]PHJ73875.1 hypothetical protein VF06_35755 [Nostoc linckia z4]PHJ87184.1 hypothetical protein VF04_34985 [Nostoc linckia z7]